MVEKPVWIIMTMLLATRQHQELQLILASTSAQDTGGAGFDTLVNIEHLLGSSYDDHLTGDAGNNRLTGNSGNDVSVGEAGDDDLGRRNRG